MWTFKWPLRVAGMDSQQVREVEATVDTGASFATLPGSLLRELEIVPMDKRGFLVADGRRVEMEYGEARATIDGKSVTTIAVFGGMTPLRCWGVHAGEPGPGCGPGGSAAGPHQHDPLLRG